MICLACLSPLIADTPILNDRATHYECSSQSCELKTSLSLNQHQEIDYYYFFLDYNPSTRLCSIMHGSQYNNFTFCGNNNTNAHIRTDFIPLSRDSYHQQVPIIFNKLFKLKAFT